MRSRLAKSLFQQPLNRRSEWILYTILFYPGGESSDIWLLETDNFNAGTQWPGVSTFMALSVAFFLIQRHPGYACAPYQVQRTGGYHSQHSNYQPSPGM